ncbi:hypothetical protein VP14_209 [Vibrio phage VPMCC14]|nr:hypothetical protein VP14_209 [Vibrio phage VPMCC14]
MKKPVIYVHKTSGATIGVYCNTDNTLQFLVEVRKRQGSNLYTYEIDRMDKVRNHFTADEAFEELACNLSADIVIAPQKELKKMFDIYKQELNDRADQRRKERENKIKRDECDQNQEFPRVFGID